MKITVIVCTFNRCQILSNALDSIAASKIPASVEWEVLVVDNNSRDQTRDVVEGFCRRYPGRFRYLFEPQGGKSFALNAGIRESRGEILAFTDDDITVEPDWLLNLTASLDGGPWAGTGGRTLPAQSPPFPSWLRLGGEYDMGGILCAHFDLGNEPRELDKAPYGANMAFRRRIFERYGGFREDLGASPTRKVPRPNEDTELGRRLMNAGERLRYEPFAIVHHPVPLERVRKEYFLDWYFDFGRAGIREVGRRPDVWGIPRRYLTISKTVVTMLVPRTIRWLLTLDPERRFYWRCRVWANAGEITEIHRQWRGPGAPEEDAKLETKAGGNG